MAVTTMTKQAFDWGNGAKKKSQNKMLNGQPTDKPTD